MTKSYISQMPQYFSRYIDLVPEMPLTDALKTYGSELIEKEKEKLIALEDKVYAPGKWTVKDVFQHLIDGERVFAYRALRIARADATPLAGFDENLYAEKAFASKRDLNEVLEEFTAVRTSSILLFNSFDDEMLLREGTASNISISCMALGFTIVGHTIHHLNIFRERYFPLID